MFKKFAILLILFSSIFMVACNNQSNNKVNVHDTNIESVTGLELVQGSTVSYYIGDTFNLYKDIYKIVPNDTNVVPEITIDNGGYKVSEYGGILHLDSQSGTVTCLRVGTAEILIELKLSKDIILSKKCKVNVLDDSVYANGIKVNDVVLNKDTSGKFDVIVTPDGYNQGFTFTSSNIDVVTVDNDGNYTTKDYGNSTITVSVKTPTGTKSATFNVLVMDDVQFISLQCDTTNLLCGKKYRFTVSSTSNLNSEFISFGINGDKVTSQIASITLVNITANAITYEICFKALGSYTLTAFYDNKISNNTVQSNGTMFEVYNPVENLEFLVNDQAVTEYTLTLIDYTYQSLATDVVYSATLDYHILDEHTMDGLTVSLSQDNVIEYNQETKQIRAVGVGETKLIVTAADENHKQFELAIKVVPAKVTKILNAGGELDNSTISLYMTQTKTFDLSVYPQYAIYKDITISCRDNDILDIQDKQLVPVGIGNTTITISCDDTTYDIDVEVLDFVKSIEINDVVVFSGSAQTNISEYNQPINVLVGDIISFSVLIKDVNDGIIQSEAVITGSQILNFLDSGMHHYSYSIIDAGDVTITIGAKFASNISSSLHIIATDPIHINSAYFENDTMLANIKETSTVFNKLITDPVEYDDVVTFKSSSDTVATVDASGTVTLVGVGDCEISCYVNDVFMCKYTLTVIDKVYATDVVSNLLQGVNTLGKDRSVKFEYTVLPAEYNLSVDIIIDNDDVLQLNDNTVYAKSVGKANVTITVEIAYNQYKEYVIKFDVIDYVSHFDVQTADTVYVNKSTDIKFVADYTLDASNVKVYIDDTLYDDVNITENIANINFVPTEVKQYKIEIKYTNQVGELVEKTTTISATEPLQDHLWLSQISDMTGEFSLNNDIVLPDDFVITNFRPNLVGNGHTIHNVTTTFIENLLEQASLDNVKFELNINKSVTENFAYLVANNLGLLNNINITGNINVSTSNNSHTSTILSNNGKINGLNIDVTLVSDCISSLLYYENLSTESLDDITITADVTTTSEFYTVSIQTISSMFNNLNISLVVNGQGASAVAGISPNITDKARFTDSHIVMTINSVANKTCGAFVTLQSTSSPLSPFVNSSLQVIYNAGSDDKSKVALFCYTLMNFDNCDFFGLNIIVDANSKDINIVAKSFEEDINSYFKVQEN